MAKALGHTVTGLYPSLVPLETVESWPFALSGITLKNVHLTAKKNGKTVYSEQGEMLLEQAWLDGGLLQKETLLRAYREGEAALISCLVGTAYDKFATAMRDRGQTAAAAERLVDDYFMDLVRTVRYTTFGASVLSAYFYAQEYAVRNIRIVIAAKRAGLSAEIIRERIRTSYV